MNTLVEFWEIHPTKVTVENTLTFSVLRSYWVLTDTNALLQLYSEHHSKPSPWKYSFFPKQDLKHTLSSHLRLFLTLQHINRDLCGNFLLLVLIYIYVLSQEDSLLDAVLSLSASCWTSKLRLLLALNLYLPNSDQSMDKEESYRTHALYDAPKSTRLHIIAQKIIL